MTKGNSNDGVPANWRADGCSRLSPSSFTPVRLRMPVKTEILWRQSRCAAAPRIRKVGSWLG